MKLKYGEFIKEIIYEWMPLAAQNVACLGIMWIFVLLLTLGLLRVGRSHKVVDALTLRRFGPK